jgi:signal peptidase I
MEILNDTVKEITEMKKRKLLVQITTIGLIAASALFIWKLLGVLCNCESPIVVVLSGSMEPAYYRGDLLILTHYDEPVLPGDVVVYELRDQAIPIVHRAIQVRTSFSHVGAAERRKRPVHSHQGRQQPGR